MLDSQAGAEWVSGTSAIVHYQFRAVPSADEVEVTLPLPDIENLWFEQAKVHQAALGAAPAAINRARQFEPLSHTRRRTQAALAVHAASRTQAIHVKLGKMGRRVKINK